MDGYPQTGTGNDVGDFLVLLFLVFFGTALVCEISNQLTTESHGT